MIRFHFSQQAPFACEFNGEIPSEGVTAVLAPSGSGKTTLFRFFLGLGKPDSASLTIAERVYDGDISLPLSQRNFSAVFQPNALIDHLSVKQNIQLAKKFAKDIVSETEEATLIHQLKIAPLLRQQPNSLSGGEKQRVAILCAMIKKSRWLLMDEALAGLGNADKKNVLKLLKSYSKQFKIPILFITHHINEVVSVADHLLILERGKVLDFGPVTDLLNKHQPDYGIITGRYRFYDAVVESWQQGICNVKIQGCILKFLTPEKMPGENIRFRLLAKDVSLTLMPTDGSILNVLKADIEDIELMDADYRAIVTLRIAEDIFFAEISYESYTNLRLKSGMSIYMQIKASAIE